MFSLFFSFLEESGTLAFPFWHVLPFFGRNGSQLDMVMGIMPFTETVSHLAR